MSSHQTCVEELFHQRVLSPLSAQNMLADGVNENWSDISSFLGGVLQKWIRVGIHSMLVCSVLWKTVVH